jgi:hypothetical protein
LGVVAGALLGVADSLVCGAVDASRDADAHASTSVSGSVSAAIGRSTVLGVAVIACFVTLVLGWVLIP